MLKLIGAIFGWLDPEGLTLAIGFLLGVLAAIWARPHSCYYQRWMEENRRALLSKKKGGGE